jgi:hypothetical protein
LDSTFSEVTLDPVHERRLGTGDNEVNRIFDREVYELRELTDVNGDVGDFGKPIGSASISYRIPSAQNPSGEYVVD